MYKNSHALDQTHSVILESFLERQEATRTSPGAHNGESHFGGAHSTTRTWDWQLPFWSSLSSLLMLSLSGHEQAAPVLGLPRPWRDRTPLTSAADQPWDPPSPTPRHPGDTARCPGNMPHPPVGQYWPKSLNIP